MGYKERLREVSQDQAGHWQEGAGQDGWGLGVRGVSPGRMLSGFRRCAGSSVLSPPRTVES